MIRLNTPVSKAPFVPTQYITLVLNAPIVSNQPFFVVSYSDGTTEITNTGTTNGITPVTIVPTQGVGINREVTFLSINNTDTAQVTVILSMNTVTGSGSGEQVKTITIFQCTLQPNYTLTYTEDGFNVFDKNGVLQQGNSSAIGSFYQTAESLGSNLTQRPTLNAFSGILMRDNPSWMRTDIYLADTGVNPGTYGGVGKYLTISVNSQGQITSISST